MKYEQLSTDYIDDFIADALYSREIEYFHYEFDKQNFEEMIQQDLPIEYKEQLKARIKETEEQMEKVEQVYQALRKQIRNEVSYKKAVKRTTLKRNLG
jgi:ferritin-like metal-binding protein YciE